LEAGSMKLAEADAKVGEDLGLKLQYLDAD
jgi:hypothetical protein